MTDEATPQAGASESALPAASAGALLRQARQAQGLHIAALAASIKVPPRKMEALEADRYHELPDNAYTRALAKTVCRSLKIDDAPVLALLPLAVDHSLEHVLHGLNTPFRERPGRSVPTDWSVLSRSTIWAPAVLVLAALSVYLLPHQRIGRQGVNTPSASAASAADAATPVVAPASAAPISSTVSPESGSTEGTGSTAITRLVQLRATGPSWIEVHDASGVPVLLRLLQPGEAVGVDGKLPLQVTVGNAAATELKFRGQAIDLMRHTRANVARIDLK